MTREIGFPGAIDPDGLTEAERRYADSLDQVGAAVVKFAFAAGGLFIAYVLAMLYLWGDFWTYFGISRHQLGWTAHYLLYVLAGLSYLALTAVLYWKIVMPALRKVRDARR